MVLHFFVRCSSTRAPSCCLEVEVQNLASRRRGVVNTAVTDRAKVGRNGRDVGQWSHFESVLPTPGNSESSVMDPVEKGDAKANLVRREYGSTDDHVLLTWFGRGAKCCPLRG